jgi:lysocardiolipin and lysophospholipid acyltransferase
MQGDAPPGVHMHFTIYPVNSTSANSPPLGRNLPKNAADAALDSQESTEEEKTEFDDWILKKWRQKDERMNQFYKNGDFVEGDTKAQSSRSIAGKEEFKRYVEIPLELKTWNEFLDLFLYGGPIILLYLIYKCFR